MKKTKTLVRVVALLFAVLMFTTACTDPVVSSNPTNTTGGSDTVKYWELLDEVSDTSDLPSWEGEVLEVSVWYAAASGTMIGDIPETDVCFKEFERVTGVRFNVEESFDNGGNNIDAKLPMVIASKDYPTIIIGYDILKQCNELWEEGYLADLTKYYEDGTLDQMLKYMPYDEAYEYVYKYMGDEDGNMFLIPNGGSASTMKIWGAIDFQHEDWDPVYWETYGKSPTNYNDWNSNAAILVRDDILKAMYPDCLTMKDMERIYLERGYFTEEEVFDLGLESPEDFFQMLYDIQELLKSGDFVGADGKPMEVTFGNDTDTDNWPLMVTLNNLMNGTPQSTEYFISADYTAEDPEDLLQISIYTDFYIDWMKKINQLVRDDVISQNSFTDSKATFKEKAKNGHYAVLYAAQHYPYNDQHGQDWSYRPIYVNTEYNHSGFGGFSTLNLTECFGIFKDTLTDAQLDQLMHAINYLNSEVGLKNFYWGPRSAGLFTEDENGVRTYTKKELIDCMLYNIDNGYATDYGIFNTSMAVPLFNIRPKGLAQMVYQPLYLSAENAERKAVDAKRYFVPGVLEGHALKDYAVFVPMSNNIYTSGLDIDGVKQFWDARAGFEKQMTKVIVAKDDEEFNRQLQRLYEYAEQNGLTEETLEEFEEKFLEANLEALKEA